MKLTNIKVFSFIHTSFMHGPVWVEERAHAGIESEWKIEGNKGQPAGMAPGSSTYQIPGSSRCRLPL